MNKKIKYLTWLTLLIAISEAFGQKAYFSSFKLFSFELGILSLLEVAILFFFAWFWLKTIAKTKASRFWLYSLFFFAGLHFVGGEVQNFLLLEKISGPLMDMATWYDSLGHLGIFASLLGLIVLLIRAEIISKKRELFSKKERLLLASLSLIASLGLVITVLKSALPIIFWSASLILLLISIRWQKRKFLTKLPISFYFFLINLFLFFLLSLWLVLPVRIKQPLVKNFVSLGLDYKIETSLDDWPAIEPLIESWD